MNTDIITSFPFPSRKIHCIGLVSSQVSFSVHKRAGKEVISCRATRKKKKPLNFMAYLSCLPAHFVSYLSIHTQVLELHSYHTGPVCLQIPPVRLPDLGIPSTRTPRMRRAMVVRARRDMRRHSGVKIGEKNSSCFKKKYKQVNAMPKTPCSK